MEACGLLGLGWRVRRIYLGRGTPLEDLGHMIEGSTRASGDWSWRGLWVEDEVES